MKVKGRQRPVYRLEGGHPLCGEIKIQGSKNAALPVLAATLLISGKCQIDNCPDILDVQCMKKMLSYVGCVIEENQHTIIVDATRIDKYWFTKQEMNAMRSSVILLGAMLGRNKKVQIYQPGGCLLGKRPIDLHLYAMECFGARIEQKGDVITATAEVLSGAEINFPISSVGATQNAVLTAVLAEGVTRIHNASCEPEVVCLCDFLVAAGAIIKGIGTRELEICGVNSLQEVSFLIPNDRIVAGTYLFAVLGTGGDVTLKQAPVGQMKKVLEILQIMGGKITYTQNEIHLLADKRPENPTFMETGVYPDFPTDLQSALLTTSCIGKGRLVLKDSIFSQRFRTVEELNRMGADIIPEDGKVMVKGVCKLEGRNVIAKELRGGASLVAAGLIAQGITTVSDIIYVERGYEDIVRDYKCLGAKIEKDS